LTDKAAASAYLLEEAVARYLAHPSRYLEALPNPLARRAGLYCFKVAMARLPLAQVVERVEMYSLMEALPRGIPQMMMVAQFVSSVGRHRPALAGLFPSNLVLLSSAARAVLS